MNSNKRTKQIFIFLCYLYRCHRSILHSPNVTEVWPPPYIHAAAVHFSPSPPTTPLSSENEPMRKFILRRLRLLKDAGHHQSLKFKGHFILPATQPAHEGITAFSITQGVRRECCPFWLVYWSGCFSLYTQNCCFFSVLTLRRLMSYIYGAPILDVSRSHTTTHHSR